MLNNCLIRCYLLFLISEEAYQLLDFWNGSFTNYVIDKISQNIQKMPSSALDEDIFQWIFLKNSKYFVCFVCLLCGNALKLAINSL